MTTTAESEAAQQPRETVAVVEGFEPDLGRLLSNKGGVVVFQPRGSTYELQLREPDGGLTATVGKPLKGYVLVKARKVYTVPTGGAFIQPIMGEPRIVQGRVTKVVETGVGRRVTVRAGANVIVDLPADDHAIDLNDGIIEEGQMINVVCAPGAAFVAAG
ncbi:MAG: hypothetical protein AAGI46_00615 [Planctomycetota bacterium]